MKPNGIDNMNRKILIISNELNNTQMILEDKLEKLINSEEPIEKIKDDIIDTLKEINKNNGVMIVWNNLIVEINNKNKEE